MNTPLQSDRNSTGLGQMVEQNRAGHSSSTIAWALLSAFTLNAHADLTEATFVSETEFSVVRTHMPDFDQLRADLFDGITGVPGSSHCGPTTLVDLFGYASLHGFPTLQPVAADWEAEENYDQVTDLIALLGWMCGTTSLGGTSMSNLATGAESYLHINLPGLMTVTQHLSTTTSSPMLSDVAESNINGAIAMVGYGIYDEIGEDPFGRLVILRDRGHGVVFTEGWMAGDSGQFFYRDPADSEYLNTQSTFKNTERWVETKLIVEAGSIWQAVLYPTREVTWIDWEYLGQQRVIDNIVYIKPRAACTWRQTEVMWIISFSPSFLDWLNPIQPIPAPQNTQVRDFTFGPLGNAIWYLDKQQPDAVLRHQLKTGHIESFEMPHATRRIAFAQNHALFVLGETNLTRWHAFAADGPNAPEMMTLALPIPCHELVMDDQANRVWLYSHQSRLLYRLSQTKLTPPQAFALPDAWPDSLVLTSLAATDQSEAPIAALGADGGVRILTATAEGTTVAETVWIGEGIERIQFNDEGDLLAFSDDGLTMFHRGEDGWAPMPDHPFSSHTFTGQSRMAVSRSNFDPSQHTGEAWYETLDQPPSGDFNLDGVVAIDDLLMLLAAFGEADDHLDLDESGQVDVNDLLILIGNWSE